MFWLFVSLVVLVFLIVFFVLYDNYYMGMKLEMINIIFSLVFFIKNFNVLVYKQLGFGSEKVYVYKIDFNVKKIIIMCLVVNIKLMVKIIMLINVMVVKYIKCWVYKNGFFKLMFGILGDDNEVD